MTYSGNIGRTQFHYFHEKLQDKTDELLSPFYITKTQSYLYPYPTTAGYQGNSCVRVRLSNECHKSIFRSITNCPLHYQLQVCYSERALFLKGLRGAIVIGDDYYKPLTDDHYDKPCFDVHSSYA